MLHMFAALRVNRDNKMHALSSYLRKVFCFVWIKLQVNIHIHNELYTVINTSGYFISNARNKIVSFVNRHHWQKLFILINQNQSKRTMHKFQRRYIAYVCTHLRPKWGNKMHALSYLKEKMTLYEKIKWN